MLRTDYQDAMYEGARRYRITPNADGTSVITDETSYTVVGTKFGANDINETNAAVNALAYGSKILALPASGWSAAAPFTQTVQVEGITAEDVPTGSLYIPPGTTADQEKALKKAAGCISYYDTGDGSITVTCIGKKPEADFQIILKGVV